MKCNQYHDKYRFQNQLRWEIRWKERRGEFKCEQRKPESLAIVLCGDEMSWWIDSNRCCCDNFSLFTHQKHTATTFNQNFSFHQKHRCHRILVLVLVLLMFSMKFGDFSINYKWMKCVVRYLGSFCCCCWYVRSAHTSACICFVSLLRYR